MDDAKVPLLESADVESTGDDTPTIKAPRVNKPENIKYTYEDVAKHASKEDCWTILHGKVYDITQYAKIHPGVGKIYLGKGRDCTELYNRYHSWVNADEFIGEDWIGMLHTG